MSIVGVAAYHMIADGLGLNDTVTKNPYATIDHLCDTGLSPGVEIRTLPTNVTGFAAWKRLPKWVSDNSTDYARGAAQWVIPPNATNDSPRILYLHGGGYSHNSPSYRYPPVTTRLAAATGMPVLVIDYRLYPEFTDPAQIQDAVQGYAWMTANGPFGPSNATVRFLAGDSAGGGLAIGLAMKLRNSPIPGHPVSGLSVVSPYSDMSTSTASHQTRAWKGKYDGIGDPMWTNWPIGVIPSYFNKTGATSKTSYISPYWLPADNLPPIMINVGDAETLLNDATDFAAKAISAGVLVNLTVWPGMWHVFNQYSEGAGTGNPLPEALQANLRQAEFLTDLASSTLSGTPFGGARTNLTEAQRYAGKVAKPTRRKGVRRLQWAPALVLAAVLVAAVAVATVFVVALRRRPAVDSSEVERLL